ncbi:MAG: CBS domain-containing protein [Halanaeroarchaeum sp.]
MPLEDLARADVVTAGPDATARDLAERLHGNNVGSVVIEEQDRPLGIVTDRDLALAMADDGMDPSTATAADLMTEDPVTAAATDGTFELCAQMRDAGVRRMPVVDGDELVGIVTFDDVIQLLADELQHLATIAATESPPY